MCGVDWAGVYYEGGGGLYGVDGVSVMNGGVDGWVDEEMGKQNLWRKGGKCLECYSVVETIDVLVVICS